MDGGKGGREGLPFLSPLFCCCLRGWYVNWVVDDLVRFWKRVDWKLKRRVWWNVRFVGSLEVRLKIWFADRYRLR